MDADPPARTSSGGCLCGGVRFEIAGPLRDVFFCHCSRCRRTHGHFSAYTSCAAADVAFLEDRTLRWFETDTTRRGFCDTCGASLFWQRENSDRISVSAGTLDPPTGLKPGRHVFLADAGDYYDSAAFAEPGDT